MVNLCTEYLSDLMSKGHVEVCHKILSPGVEHKDMVRPVGLGCGGNSRQATSWRWGKGEA